MAVDKPSVVILAGGRGARFDHESQVKPKPLIEVAGKPILGHIMDLFEAQGFDDFIVLGGYLNEQLSDYLATRYTCRDTIKTHPYITVFGEPGGTVKCHLFDTGVDATTGDRLMKLACDFMPRTDDYFLTYGDGLSDVDLNALLAQHRASFDGSDRGVTVTAVHPPGRFGVMDIDPAGLVTSFSEKPSEGWINGGFMVVSRGVVLVYGHGDTDWKELDDPCPSWESGALPYLAEEGLLKAFKHDGFWMCMDTRRDLEQIEKAVQEAGRLPWIR